MKILITGGAGFIGSNIADKYIEEGNDVVVVDNFSKGNKNNLNKKIKFYKLDILNKRKLEKVFKKEKPDIVNHHAAQINVIESISNIKKDFLVNVLGTLNVLDCCVKNNTKKIIYASTCAVYGNVEKKYLPVNEKNIPNPISPYGTSKYCAENYIKLYKNLYDLNYTIFRYGNVYGPRQYSKGEAGVIAIFIDKMLKNERPIIYGDGKQTRDYIYVKDVAKINLLALNKGDNKIYNVGTGKETSVLEIFSLLKKKLNFKKNPIFLKEREGEIRRICLNSKKASQELGWKIEYNLEEGINEIINFIKKK